MDSDLGGHSPLTPTRRFPKDLAATLMTMACADAVLHVDGHTSAHSWEASQHGVVRRKYGSGPKTRGSMARNRSGQVVVSPERLHHWERDRSLVKQNARSPLWSQLRHPRELTDPEFNALESTAHFASHSRLPVAFFFMRYRISEKVLLHLAACATFDAIAVLWSLLLEAQRQSQRELAMQCARYVPPALALLGSTACARRVAFLIFARMRQLTLDAMRFKSRQLALADFDLPHLSTEAADLPPLELEHTYSGNRERFDASKQYRGSCELHVPESRAEWIWAHLPGLRTPRRSHQKKWTKGQGPLSPPDSTGNPLAHPPYHREAIARMRTELGPYA